MAHLSLVPKQEMTDDLSLSNRSYQDEQEIDDQLSNNDAYEVTNLVFISPANQDLGFEFEDTQPLDLETTAEVQEEQEKVLFTGEEGSQLVTVKIVPCSSSISSPGTNYEHKMNPRTRSQKKYISSDSSSTINNETSLQSKPTSRSASTSSKRSNKRVQKHKKSFQCDWPDCNANLSTAETLRRHKRIHTGEKPYICDWPDCGHGFTQSNELHTHKMKHTGLKPFLCDWPNCKKRFITLSAFNTHKRIHTGEKPFACDWSDCKKRFTQSGHLITHKRIHTREKPYVCDWPDCNGQQRFATQSGLNRHKRSHTNIIIAETPEECEQDNIVKVELDPFELD